MQYGSDYAGSRFHMADLQVQTPADDHHWEEPATAIALLGEEGAATALVERCYAIGLEVVAITDHNFASKSFIPRLKSEALRLAPKYGYDLTILPGFELQANVGRGCHVLCVFEPDADLEELDHRLTQCGVPMPRANARGAHPSVERLPAILAVVQRREEADGRLHGLVILPHIQGEEGLFDTARISEWLQQIEFTNPELLAIEVPKPPALMNENWQKLFRSGEGCDPAWRRRRAIATIMSSDAKALSPGGSPNHLGRRHTWVKMSRPSIEALRQSFLDHASRIRLSGPRPELDYIYPAMRRLRVSDAAFLSDLDVALSMNLNAIIGGGGSGKSTLVEYLRIALGQEGSVYGDAAANLQRLRRTIKPTTTIEVLLERDGSTWLVRSTGGKPGVIVSGEEIPELAKFFPVRFFSQREIYAIAEDHEARSRLLDNLIRDKLDALDRHASDLAERLRTIDGQLADEPALAKRLADLQTEVLDLATRIENLQRLEEPIRDWRALAARTRGLRDGAAAARAAATELGQAVPQATSEEGATGDPTVDDALARFRQSTETLRDDVATALARHEARIASVEASEAIRVLLAEFAAKDEEYTARRAELMAKGVDPDRLRAYEADLAQRRNEVLSVEARLGRLHELAAAWSGVLAELRETWAHEAALRTEAAASLSEFVPKTRAGEPFIRVVVVPFGDEPAFEGKLASYRRDGRRISDDQWQRLAREAFRATPDGVSPVDTFVEWVRSLRTGVRPAGFPWELDDRETGVLLDWLDEAALRKIEIIRVPDKVTVRLFRQDGSEAGDLDGGLSVGQRCTAILAVVLAQDDAPVVIDQPEDEVDNEFTYRDLVPLLRRAKEKRQIILTTHDPNIPVNGDAELILALEATQGCGAIKVIDGRRCLGALDQSHVQQAVEDIMEGSEDAFRRRFEMYGF